MLKIKNVTAKNFLSIGNTTQSVNLGNNQLTLVLGVNEDLGGDSAGSRNGVGKTVILNALSYALYGQALTNIKKDNLINHTNNKGMLVTVDFENNNNTYRIERGRKPNVLKYYINNSQVKTDELSDDSQGDSRETQKEIEKILSMSHTMFKHLVALNTYTEPFLSMKAADQREVIEQLLGITLLSEKAEALKLQIKETKDSITAEELKINAIKIANENVQKSISSLTIKSSAWNHKQSTDLADLSKAIAQLESVDIAKELESHALLKVWADNNNKITSLTKQKSTLESAMVQGERTLNKYLNELEKLSSKTCPSCEQELHDHKHEEMTAISIKHVEESAVYLDKIKKDLEDIQNSINAIGDQPLKPRTFYELESEALGHKNNLEHLLDRLQSKADELNPYNEQIKELENTAIQEINWDTINDKTKFKDHQEFLLKLLTNKDSFIRKKIIDQSLSYLNKRLSYYIDKLGLPHKVEFLNDLSVEISQMGQNLDFDNLSRGERNRLILSMSFSFRDVWEGLYQHINLLFIDELIDAGMDSAGVEAALSVLKTMTRERNKNVYLISHRDELVIRVNNVLRVVKESGFTSYSNDIENVD